MNGSNNENTTRARLQICLFTSDFQMRSVLPELVIIINLISVRLVLQHSSNGQTEKTPILFFPKLTSWHTFTYAMGRAREIQRKNFSRREI